MKYFILLLVVSITTIQFMEATANGCFWHRRLRWVQSGEQDCELTGAVAKRALLEMAVRQIPSGVLVPAPKDEPIQVLDTDKISIGIYHCDLKERTFYADALFPNAPRHSYNQLHGIFERTAEGKWVAKITRSLSGH